MVLAVNIGNSYTKFAVFDENDEMLLKFSVSSYPVRSSDEYRLLINSFLSEFENKKHISVLPQYAVIASVVPSLTAALADAICGLTGKRPFIIGAGTRTGFRIRIDNNAELGADIVANVAASLHVVNAPFVVVDVGTATTLTVVERTGDVIGTLIHPGIVVSALALSNCAARLFEVGLSKPEKLIGQNSDESVKSGLIYGHSCMIDGLISKIGTEICADNEDLSVVITGDYSSVVAPFCRTAHVVAPDLTLKGALILFRLNVKRT